MKIYREERWKLFCAFHKLNRLADGEGGVRGRYDGLGEGVQREDEVSPRVHVQRGDDDAHDVQKKAADDLMKELMTVLNGSITYHFNHRYHFRVVDDCIWRSGNRKHEGERAGDRSRQRKVQRVDPHRLGDPQRYRNEDASG